MRIDSPSAEQIPALKQLWQEVFGDDDFFVEAFFGTAFEPRRCRCITVDGTLAAMLYWLEGEYRGEKYAYIYGVATHPGFRGRGLCAWLMEDVHDLLARQGYAGAILRPAEDGLRRMYGKMGYVDCCAMRELSCSAGTPVPLREIDREEYGHLRRRYLPKDGLIQEGGNLAFLERLAGFYAGEDFLLTAWRAGERLNGIELLGNAHMAPGILAALGCKTGSFRTPGGEGAFAMMRSLREGAPVPGYLGFVFD